MAATDDSGRAVRQLAWLLEEAGDVEGAIAAYRQAGRAVAGNSHSAFELAQLLARHGRGSEAIEVMRAQADIHNGDDCNLHTLAELCLDSTRADRRKAWHTSTPSPPPAGARRIGTCTGYGCR